MKTIKVDFTCSQSVKAWRKYNRSDSDKAERYLFIAFAILVAVYGTVVVYAIEAVKIKGGLL